MWLQRSHSNTQPALQSQDSSSCQVWPKTTQSSYPYLYHYNIASFVASFAIPLGYWRPSSVIYGAAIPAQAYFWPSKVHAWLCKSIQWLLLPLILHEHVTLFWRPLCFQSMPLHLFIFFRHFSFSFLLARLIVLLTWPGTGSMVLVWWLKSPFDDTARALSDLKWYFTDCSRSH